VDVKLIRFKEDGARRDFRVKGARCTIGREPGCTIQIPSPAVSRRHCEVCTAGDRLFVRDLGSSNGTFVNEARVAGEADLTPGDRLAVGPIVFVVQADGVPENPEPPLLESPAMRPTPKAAPKPAESGSGPLGVQPGGKGAKHHADDSAADIADLIARATSSLNEGEGGDESSAFDFEIDLDEEDK